MAKDTFTPTLFGVEQLFVHFDRYEHSTHTWTWIFDVHLFESHNRRCCYPICTSCHWCLGCISGSLTKGYTQMFAALVLSANDSLVMTYDIVFNVIHNGNMFTISCSNPSNLQMLTPLSVGNLGQDMGWISANLVYTPPLVWSATCGLIYTSALLTHHHR